MSDSATTAEPSAYELRARAEIAAWKNPTLGFFGQAMKILNTPLDFAGDQVMKIPGVGWVIEKSVGGIVSLGNDAAQWSVRPDAILQEFQSAGRTQVKTRTDVLALDLEDVDKVVGWLGAKYKGIAATEGAATGAAGLPGLPVDIVAIVTLNLRAIGEYATYYGFDVSSQQERLFAMNVLGLASSPSDAAKTVAMAQLVRIAQDVAKKRVWKQLEKHTFVQLLQQIAKALGIRLTKGKLAQSVPIAGAVVGAGFNVYFTNRVCDAAYFLYRERFLAAKYGADWIGEPVEPADTLDPRYPEGPANIGSTEPPPANSQSAAEV